MFAKPWLRILGFSLISLLLIKCSITIAMPRNDVDNDDDCIDCHRKLHPGKKVTELLVKRAVSCQNVQDCFWACNNENAFVCKGFNYRRDGDGSEDTCELTSTPYLRMNLDRDIVSDSRYDYYERDRNCIPFVNTPAPWADQPRRYEDDYHEKKMMWALFDHATPNSRGTSFYPHSSPLDRTYTADLSNTPTIKSNEQRLYENSNDFSSPRRGAQTSWNWQRPETSHYMGNFIPERRINYGEEYLNVAGPSIPLNFHSVDRSHSLQSDSFPAPSPEQFDGKLYKYGSAFDYNNNYVPATAFEEHGKVSAKPKCSVQIAAGSKLSRGIVRKTCLALEAKECEELCINEASFSCRSFAHRYNVLTTNPTDNCLLSDISYQDLHFYTDIEPDRDYDSYVLSQDSIACYSKKPLPNRYPSEECFSRVRSGFNIPADITKKSLFTHDLGECQFACTMSQEFVCRSIAFQYATTEYPAENLRERVPLTNCFLTDWPSTDINPANMPDKDGVELYERSSFSYGCEAFPSLFPTLPNQFIASGQKLVPLHTDDNNCYSENRKPCRLRAHAIVSSIRATTKSECSRICSTMRNVGTIPCMSFAYTGDTANVRNNCQLSDISMRDLRPNLDYTYDGDHTLYTLNEYNPHCSPLFKPISTVLSSAVEEPSTLFPHGSSYMQQDILDGGMPFHFSSQPKNQFKLENHIADYERELSKENVASRPPQSFTASHHGFASVYSPELSSFRRYTVNGYPCKNATVCQPNQIAGFWSCETENSEFGGWDYCCKPNHRCGYSRGYHYPWCYVGLNEDQWRPCSETYYPYYLSKDHSFYRQSPTYSARHWPIVYLHETLPPNCTIDTPNDRGYNLIQRRTNFL